MEGSKEKIEKKGQEGKKKEEKGSQEAKGKEEGEKKRKEYQIEVYRAWCKNCGICVAFCPNEVLKRGEDGGPYAQFPDKCKGCILCELRCPDFAIRIIEKKEKKRRV